MGARLQAAALMAVSALAAGACASGDDAEASPPDDAAEGVIEITGVDYAFTGVPATAEPGTELEFVNESPDEVHELILARIPDEEDRDLADLLELPPDEVQGIVMPGLQGVSVAAPQEPGRVVNGELVLDEPGRYALLCLIPTGADPEEFMAAAAESDGPPEVDGGPPHTVEGMYAEIVVED